MIKWTVCIVCLVTCSVAQSDMNPSTFRRNDYESNRLHGVTAQDDDNLHTHTQHSEKPEISHNYVTSNDFPSSAIAVNVLGQIKGINV